MGLVFHRGRPSFAHLAKGGNHTAGAMGLGLNYAGREPTNPIAARQVAPITKSSHEFLTVLNQNNWEVRIS